MVIGFREMYRQIRKEPLFARELRQRSQLTDNDFYDRFYAGTGIPKDIPARVRKVCECNLAVRSIHPDDRVVEVYEEIDFCEMY